MAAETPYQRLWRAAEKAGNGTTQFNRREKILLVVGAGVSVVLFWFGGRTFHLPVMEHFSISLLQQSMPVRAIVSTAIVYVVSVLLGAVIAGRVGFDAGMFCASLGLAALRLRGGEMRYILLYSSSANIWLLLTWEIVLLAAITLAGWTIQYFLLHKLLPNESHQDDSEAVDVSASQRLYSLGTGLVVMVLSMLLFTQSDRIPQVMAAVAISSFLATAIAYSVLPTRPSFIYWSIPLIVGVGGYVMAWFDDGGGRATGMVRGAFAGLARPVPLDYAGIGVASAILAYWLSRRWQKQSEEVLPPVDDAVAPV